MKEYNSRLTGILGAVIVHLIAAIVFMLVKLGNLDIREYRREYEIALEEPPVMENMMQSMKMFPITVEQLLSDDRDLLNIARNLASQPDVKIDREDYIDKVKEELIKTGKLGTDNYIDEQKRKADRSDAVELSEGDKKSEPEKKPGELQEMESRYSGPTRIYYNLPGRVHAFLPIPIYKCEGSGKVVLSIEVNPKGIVISASVIESDSTTGDPCLVEAAVSSALKTRFNADAGAIKNQAGTLTYHFVAQ